MREPPFQAKRGWRETFAVLHGARTVIPEQDFPFEDSGQIDAIPRTTGNTDN